jgi:hypothetical protein
MNHYFRVVATGQEVLANDAPYEAAHAAGAPVFLDNLKGPDKRGTWVKIIGLRSITNSVKTANVHWDVEVTSKPQ